MDKVYSCYNQYGGNDEENKRGMRREVYIQAGVVA